MKQMVLGCTFLLLMIYASYINMNVCERMNREVDLSQVVTHCVRQTVLMDSTGAFDTNKDMREFFSWILNEEISSDGKLSVRFIFASRLLGVLYVHVTQEYESTDGKKQKIEMEKGGIIIPALPDESAGKVKIRMIGPDELAAYSQ